MLIRPGGAHAVGIELLARLELRSTARSWADLSGRAFSRARRSDGGALMPAARIPAQASGVTAALSPHVCAAPPPLPPRPDSHLTAPACASSTATVHPGRPSMTACDVSETSDLLYIRHRVGLGALGPTWGCSLGWATMLSYVVTERIGRGRRVGWPVEEGLWVGRRVCLGGC